jgi:hypothetical protein
MLGEASRACTLYQQAKGAMRLMHAAHAIDVAADAECNLWNFPLGPLGSICLN